jgi:predicted nucleic acid-binding protein
MRKILIDTNIVLDFALQRQKFGENAKSLILYIAKNGIKSFVTASSITDIYYILRKAKGHTDAISFLKNFVKLTKVTGVDAKIIIEALNSAMKDFEDAVQTETAIYNNIDIIITRDKKDYKNSGLQVFSPTEYINELNKIE